MNRKVLKSNITDDIKERFNDICIRELGLFVEDNTNRIVDFESQSYLQMDNKYIKYPDEEFPINEYNEVELNLLENSKMLSILFGLFVQRYADRNNLYIHSYCQSTGTKGTPGTLTCNFVINGIITPLVSDPFINESTRMLNLICKINKSTNLYDFRIFNVI